MCHTLPKDPIQYTFHSLTIPKEPDSLYLSHRLVRPYMRVAAPLAQLSPLSASILHALPTSTIPIKKICWNAGLLNKDVMAPTFLVNQRETYLYVSKNVFFCETNNDKNSRHDLFYEMISGKANTYIGVKGEHFFTSKYVYVYRIEKRNNHHHL